MELENRLSKRVRYKAATDIAPMERKLRVFAGIFLILGIVLFPLAAGHTVYQMPQYYFSKATVEFKSKDSSGRPGKQVGQPFDPAVAQRAVEAVMAPLGAGAEALPIRQTDLYELRVWDQDPMQAAVKANMAAITLQQQNPIRVKLWEKAEPALAPGRPQVMPYLAAGLGVGLLSFVVGVMVLCTGARPGETGDGRMPQAS